jgi:MFS family permease
MATMNAAESRRTPMTAEEKKVILASSAGTIFEWYDFYLYGSLAAIIGAKFFSAFPPSTRAIYALLAFAAGFLVRPFGAIIFGRLGDLVGRKYTFLITILIMGLSTFFVGLLPDYNTIGVLAPVLLIALRMAQGLALGGEYGGAAVYVAEHAPPGRRGFYTSWIQTTATLGLLLSLFVIVGLRLSMGEKMFTDDYPLFFGLKGGWRIPFLASIFLLAISVIIRLTMNESPAFQKMKDEGARSKAPLNEAFGEWPKPLAFAILALVVASIGAMFMGQTIYALFGLIAIILTIVGNMFRFSNGRIVVLALLGLVVGQAVVWYTGQFYALFFLQSILKVDLLTANVLVAWSLIIGTPFFLFFGWLSDKIGRKIVILSGCAIAAATYMILFPALTTVANPTLASALDKVKIEVGVDRSKCGTFWHMFDPVGTTAMRGEYVLPCDIARRSLAAAALKYDVKDLPAGSPMKITINGTEVPFAGAADAPKLVAAAQAAGYPKAGDKDIIKLGGFFEALTNPRALALIGILTIMVIYVTAVYGPIAAMLVEFFPTRIRYTAMSLPYHIGNGWFGGLLPATSFAMSAGTGDIYYGLWYPIGFAIMTVIIGLLFVKEPGESNIDK